MMAAQKTMTTLEAAQAYVAQGWSVIPLKTKDKRPLISWKEFQKRMATAEELAEWFDGTDNNVGIVTGKLSNLTIVDCDSEAAIQLFTDRCIEHDREDALDTYGVVTPKGRHFYYDFVPDSKNFQSCKEWPGIDLRSEDGYVVAPPSIHPSGAAYVLHGEPDALKRPAPLWLMAPRRVLAPELDEAGKVGVGERHPYLISLAGTMRRRNMSQGAIEEALRTENRNRCVPEIDDADVVKMAKNVMRYASAEDNHQETADGKVDEWPEPIPLEDQSLPELPNDLFPSWMENMVNAVALATETPKELAATLGLAALATTCQRTFEVEPEPGYVEPVNVWGIAAMESGNRKTAVLNAMTAPLQDYEREQAEQLIPERTRIESERKTLESRIQHLRTQAAKANSVDSVDVIKEIAELEASLPNVPTIPQLWAQDITPEKLGDFMAEHGGVMALISDEGGIFETIAGRYNKGIPNLDLLLQSHSGSHVRIHRASREPIDMPRPVLSMGLSAQPDVLRGLVQKPGFRGRGLLARFLYTLPPSRLGYRPLKSSPIPMSVKESYSQALHSLLAMKAPQSDGNQPERFRLQLSPRAHREWKEFSLVVEKDLRDGKRFEHIRDWAGKLPGAAARVAGLLHCVIHFKKQPWSTPIELTTMKKTLTLMAILAAHALRAFEVMAANPDLEKAKKILAWVQRKAIPTFTQRDCHHDLQGTFPRIEDLKPALKVLEERYIIRQTNGPQHGPGRRSIVYDVHPHLIQEPSV